MNHKAKVKSTVLIADDDFDIRFLLEKALTPEFNVILCENGLDAVNLFRLRDVDIVLLDVQMDKMNGFEACEIIHRESTARFVPIVMITAMNDAASIDKAFALGANDFITKPIDWTIICHRIRYFLKGSFAFQCIKDREEREKALFRAIPDTVIRISMQGEILDCHLGEAVEDFDCIKREIGGSLRSSACVNFGIILDQQLRELRTNGFVNNFEFEVCRPTQKTPRIYESRATKSGKEFIFVIRNITVAKNAEKKIEHLAFYDSLTDLPNRSLLYRCLEKILNSRESCKKFAVLFIDLDNFKRVNDSFGHAMGDRLLVEVASRLKGVMRKNDFTSRLSGDEFIMVINNIEEPLTAARVAERVLESLSDTHIFDGHDVVVTPSIGISIYPEDGKNSEELVKNADRAMYISKRLGKQAYRFFNESMNTDSLQRLDLETALRKAIDLNQITAYYQPKIKLSTGRVDGFEVLARWTNAGQVIPPAKFIPIAEEAGLMHILSEKLFSKVCEQYKQWVANGIGMGQMAVNLSPQQFNDSRLVDKIKSILSNSGLSPEHLEFELTESMVIGDTNKVIHQMCALRDIGISLAIDDFGTGYSSLSYLKKFPINTLKIDRSFVRDMLQTERDKNIVELIVDMAHTLDMEIVAEGVETAEQGKVIRNMGAEKIQGYLFSHPLPAQEFEKVIRTEIMLN